MHVAKVSGTPYEMGCALSQLYATEINDNLNGFIDFYVQKVEDYLADFGVSSFTTQFIVD